MPSYSTHDPEVAAIKGRLNKLTLDYELLKAETAKQINRLKHENGMLQSECAGLRTDLLATKHQLQSATIGTKRTGYMGLTPAEKQRLMAGHAPVIDQTEQIKTTHPQMVAMEMALSAAEMALDKLKKLARAEITIELSKTAAPKVFIAQAQMPVGAKVIPAAPNWVRPDGRIRVEITEEAAASITQLALEGKSVSEIARLTKCPKPTVRRALLAAGVTACQGKRGKSGPRPHLLTAPMHKPEVQEEIRKLRAQGLTQNQVAKIVGMAQSEVSKCEMLYLGKKSSQAKPRGPQISKEIREQALEMVRNGATHAKVVKELGLRTPSVVSQWVRRYAPTLGGKAVNRAKQPSAHA